MKYKIMLIFGILLIIPFIQANWLCGGITYGDCPSSYPVELCLNYLAMCISPDYDTDEYCCTSGCDEASDYLFCDEGDIANCKVISPYGGDMVCCPSDFPKYNEETNTCWKENWQCINDEGCNYGYICSNHQCILRECERGEKKCVGSTYYECRIVYPDNYYTWVNVGIIKDKCGIECIENLDCPESSFIGDKFCSNNNVVKQKTHSTCEDNSCTVLKEDTILEFCEDSCEEGICIKIEQPNYIIYILGLISFTIFLIWIYRKTKK